MYLPAHYKTLISVGQTVIAGETLISNPNNIKNKIIKIKNIKNIKLTKFLDYAIYRH